MTEVVTLGETMALVAAPDIGLLRHASTLRLSCGGAESNLAIGVARLGHSATWIGRVGDDEFGVMIRRMLGAEGVASRVLVDQTAPTGLMVKYRRTGTVTHVVYYRKGSAGSRLDASDIDVNLIQQARVLHLTGITPALSPSTRIAMEYAIEVARSAGVLVSLDVNYRSKLWSPAEAGAVLVGLVRQADIVFATEPEARLVVDGTSPDELGAGLAALGPAEVVIKRGALGAFGIAHGDSLFVQPYQVTEVDPVGAGDAFAAGYLCALLDGAQLDRRLDTGALAGAFAVTVPGDWEGLPFPADLNLLRVQDGVLR
jgi:2-dehydro-3-deoxygluconokinase